MLYTEKLGLRKPEGTDSVNIEDLNYNADVIDGELSKLENKADKSAIIDGTLKANADRLQGKTIVPTEPTINQILKFDGTKWGLEKRDFFNGSFSAPPDYSDIIYVDIGVVPKIIIFEITQALNGIRKVFVVANNSFYLSLIDVAGSYVQYNVGINGSKISYCGYLYNGIIKYFVIL